MSSSKLEVQAQMYECCTGDPRPLVLATVAEEQRMNISRGGEGELETIFALGSKQANLSKHRQLYNNMPTSGTTEFQTELKWFFLQPGNYK